MRIVSVFFIITCLLPSSISAQTPHAARLYGMTQYGSNYSKGSIFHYTPATNTFTTDYNFQIKAKGRTPKCEIVAGNNGKYYGTTSAGGDYNAGVLFEWDSATSVYKDLHNFTGSHGKDARGGMVLYNNKLYGTTNEGGTNNYGVIYEWDIATNTYTKKIDLDSAAGRNPTGSLTVVNNLFYGFTSSGGVNDKGVLFEWNPVTNVYTKQFDFDSIKGSNPVGKLAAYNGKLYAMCNKGGAFDAGTIYQWDYTNNTVTKTFDFNNTNGAFPMGYLSLYNNKFYGTTFEGGIYQTGLSWEHYGVIFEYNPANNVFIKKKDLGFQNGLRGPFGSLTLKDNIFWSTASDDAGTRAGGIFTWNPATNQVVTKYIFFVYTASPCEIEKSAMGYQSFESLLLSGNYLLGSFSAGGGNNFGSIFRYYPDSNQFVHLVNMEATDGSYPKGSLTKLGNKLYGMTFQGGNDHAGNIFEWDLTTQQFKERFQLDGITTGLWPKGSLTFYIGKFYGINSKGKIISGGGFNQRESGDYFSWDPATNIYQSLLSAEDARSTPVLLNNKLYSTAKYPTNDFGGVISAFNPAANTLTNAAYFPISLGNFSSYQGLEGANGVTYYNGKFYGMTTGKVSSGTTPFRGTIYEWDTTTTVITHRYDFTDSIGTYPTGNLLLVGNEFYGLTSNVGNSTLNYPGLFKWNPVTNVLNKLNRNFGDYAFGTPTLSGGKIYYMKEGSFLQILEYDPVLDTTIVVHDEAIPLFQQGGNWNYTNCTRPPSYQQLLEVIPNELPQLSNTPVAQTLCANLTNDVTFTISDADLDTMQFQIISSNIALIPVANISITNVDSNYTLHFVPLANQAGTTIITVTANDGYGGSVNFSFTITVNALPTVSITSTPASGNICEGEFILLNGSGAATYTWTGGVINNNAFIPPVGSTTYTVTGSDANGCSNTNTQTVTVNILPTVSSTITPASTTFCEGETIILNGSGAISYTWSGAVNNNTAFFPPVGTTTYTVTGTDANGCSNINSQTVIVNPGIISSITINSNINQGNIGDAIVYTATTNLINPYVINWYRDNSFQASTTTNSWSTNIVSGNNAVKAILSASSQCLQPDSSESNVFNIKRIDGVSVYPNPTTGEVMVTGLMPDDNIGLYNSIGQRMITTTGKIVISDQNKLQLKNLAAGTYILSIKRNATIFVKKIVKINQ